jgi:hypothetical protein
MQRARLRPPRTIRSRTRSKSARRDRRCAGDAGESTSLSPSHWKGGRAVECTGLEIYRASSRASKHDVDFLALLCCFPHGWAGFCGTVVPTETRRGTAGNRLKLHDPRMDWRGFGASSASLVEGLRPIDAESVGDRERVKSDRCEHREHPSDARPECGRDHSAIDSTRPQSRRVSLLDRRRLPSLPGPRHGSSQQIR